MMAAGAPAGEGAQARWSAVDEYIGARLATSDAVLDAVLAANAAAGLPAIDVSPAQGKLLHLIARMAGARRILEVGTLGGYSTVWLARALPEGGALLTLEIEPSHVEVARANVDRAGMGAKVDIRVGPAARSLAAMDDSDPFDFVFIDADKPNNPLYVREALRLSRPGTIIVVDNVVRDGRVVEFAGDDPNSRGAQAVFDLIAAEPRLSATAIQTVGAKGWDGFVIAIVDG